MNKKTILFASDHAGFKLKNSLAEFVRSLGYTVEDLGAATFDPSDDYPALIMPLAMRIAEQPEKSAGIIFGKSGQGEAIVANRFPGVRAIVYYGVGQTADAGGKNARGEGVTAPQIIKLGREHNDSNVLSIGADFVTIEEARAAVELWLATPFSGDERHARRIEMIDNIS